MQISAVILALVACVAAAPAPEPAPAPVPQFNVCFDSFDCGLGKSCQNLQCVAAAPGSPEAAIASAVASLFGQLTSGAGLPAGGFPGVAKRWAEAQQ